MSSAGHPSAPPSPSIFISYASEDRDAARALRDYLAAAGLDVWYDENELGGGDAWDQKIRRQIRDCDYFMPVISQTTERRKEGYFRREWRLAAERTLDMADDVLFLLPVTIDQTSENSARVPEKFVAVQWLRVPGGQPTPALEALRQRLLAGDHTALPPPAPAAPVPLVPAARAPAGSKPPSLAPPPIAHDGPPPMPPFPHAPEKNGVGHWLKFTAEILWWLVAVVWVLLGRLPKWGRVVLVAWLVFGVIGVCQRNDRGWYARNDRDRPPPHAPNKERPPGAPKGPDLTAAISAEINSAVEASTQAIIEATMKARAEGRPPPEGRAGQEMGRRSGQRGALDPDAAGKALLVVPFDSDPTQPAAAQFAAAVFQAVQENLQAARPGETAATGVSLPNVTDTALTALGRNLGSHLVLGAHIKLVDTKPVLTVRVVRTNNGNVVWSGEFSADADVSEVAKKIVTHATAHLPPRP